MRFSIGTGSAEVESEFAPERESVRKWGLVRVRFVSFW